MTIMSESTDLDPGMLAGPDVPVDLGPLPGLVGYALRRAQLVVFQDFHHHVADADIRPVQFSVLAALGIKRTNFVPLLDGLEARGLAERRRVKGDRRASALFLTEQGAETLGRLERRVAAHEAKFAARLGPNGPTQLLSLLQRLTDPAFDPG